MNAFASGSGSYPCPDGCGHVFKYVDYADDPPSISLLPSGYFTDGDGDGGQLSFCPECDAELSDGYHDRIQKHAPGSIAPAAVEPSLDRFLADLENLRGRRIESVQHALVAAEAALAIACDHLYLHPDAPRPLHGVYDTNKPQFAPASLDALIEQIEQVADSHAGTRFEPGSPADLAVADELVHLLARFGAPSDGGLFNRAFAYCRNRA